jgi:Xaa-Pro aminopeptidase
MMKWEPPLFDKWLVDNMPKGSKVGVDEAQLPFGQFEKVGKMLADVEVELLAGSNLVDEVWGADRPGIPSEKVWHLEDKYTGQNTLSKYEDLAKEIPDSDSLLITTLDDIAWLLNLRGNDISYNPLFFSYLLFNKKDGDYSVDLFVDATKLSEVEDYMKSIKVNVLPYESIKEFIAGMEKRTVTIDPSNCNVMLHNALKAAGHTVKMSACNVT